MKLRTSEQGRLRGRVVIRRRGKLLVVRPWGIVRGDVICDLRTLPLRNKDKNNSGIRRSFSN